MNPTLLPLRGLGILGNVFTKMSLGLASPNREEGNYSPRESARAKLSSAVGYTLKRHLHFTSGEGWSEFTPHAEIRPFIVRVLDQIRDCIYLPTAEVSTCCWSCRSARSPSAFSATQQFADKLNEQIGMKVFSVSSGNTGTYLVACVSPYEVNSFRMLVAACSIAIRRQLAELEGSAAITPRGTGRDGVK